MELRLIEWFTDRFWTWNNYLHDQHSEIKVSNTEFNYWMQKRIQKLTYNDNTFTHLAFSLDPGPIQTCFAWTCFNDFDRGLAYFLICYMNNILIGFQKEWIPKVRMIGNCQLYEKKL